MEVLNKKPQHSGTCKIPWKEPKTSHSNQSGYIENGIIYNMWKNKNWNKCENPIFYGQNKLLFWHPTLQLLSSFRELEFDLLGAFRQLVKYVVCSSKRIEIYIYSSLHKVPKQQMTNFWSQRIFGIKMILL
jgi:hypothetical protein